MSIQDSKPKHLFLFLSAIICIFVYSVLFFLYTYSLRQDKAYQKRISTMLLDDISSSIDTSLKSIKSKAISCSQSVEFLYFSNKKSSRKVTGLADQIGNKQGNSIFASSEVAAFSLYNSACDIHRNYIRSYSYSFLESKLPEITAQLLSRENANYGFSTYTLNHHCYITYLITRRYGTVLVVIDPQKNKKLESYDNSALYHDLELTFMLTDSSIDEQSELTVRIGSMDLYLVQETEPDPIFRGSHKIMTRMIVIVFLFIPFAFLMIYKLLIQPMNSLSKEMEQISSGNPDYRLRDNYFLSDINRLALDINTMLDRIQVSRTAEFNSRMDSLHAKLQFLQLQIRPHFLLNCLKNLISLINLHKYEEAKTLSFYLSDYLSYNFSDTRNFVSLKSELNSVQSYVKLCSMLSYEIELLFNIDGNSINAECLPMSILSFVENSIKHTRNISSLQISITTQVMNDSEGAPILKTVIRDNGGGFPPEYLDEFQAVDPSKMVYRKNRIGITNISYRLWLIYGGRASLRVYNEGSRAVIEITQPYERMAERSSQ